MGRIATKGLTYFPLDTSWETAVKLVKAKYGTLEGVGFLSEIWASIYRENYYRKWDEETELLFADEIKKPVAWVHEVIDYCLQKGIFDQSIYSVKHVLTSHGIQRRYFRIVISLKRTDIDFIDGITYPEFMPKNKSGFPQDNSGGNGDNSGGYSEKQGKNDNSSGGYTDARKGKEGKGIEELGAARAPEVNSSQEAQDLAAFAYRLAVKRKAKKPEAMALKLMTEPDVILAFEAERSAKSNPKKPKKPLFPDPPTCCQNGEIRTTHPGDIGRCTACGALWEYDPGLGEEFGWQKTVEGETENTG